jgi:ribosome-associated heat shock protein Hsp15
MSDAARLDKWLWQARFYKSRSLASRACSGRRLRLNRIVVAKAHHLVRVGDVLTFVKGERLRVVRVCALATRRGPASEAQTLYEDLTPVDERTPRESAAGLAPGPWGGRYAAATRRQAQALSRRRTD